jgi:hypothetical protein
LSDAAIFESSLVNFNLDPCEWLGGLVVCCDESFAIPMPFFDTTLFAADETSITPEAGIGGLVVRERATTAHEFDPVEISSRPPRNRLAPHRASGAAACGRIHRQSCHVWNVTLARGEDKHRHERADAAIGDQSLHEHDGEHRSLRSQPLADNAGHGPHRSAVVHKLGEQGSE